MEKPAKKITAQDMKASRDDANRRNSAIIQSASNTGQRISLVGYGGKSGADLPLVR